MKIYILPDFFSGLTNWFVKDEAPKGMPAVYNFLKVLGTTPHGGVLGRFRFSDQV